MNEHDDTEMEEDIELEEQGMTCGCCFEELKEPTTLTCGHTFCRLCIAKWYLSSGQKICPTCRQAWYGIPKVNVFMRSITRRNVRGVGEPEAIEAPGEEQDVLSKFEKKASQNVEKSANEGVGTVFCSGICFSIVVSVMIYIAWYYGFDHGNTNPLLYKPVGYWSVDDVCNWLSGMGSWTDQYVAAVRHMEIKGSLLLVIGEEEVDSIFNVTIPLHKKAILKAIDIVREHGTKVPTDLWEFKSLYPGKTLFLSYGLKDFPRATILYMYIFQYNGLFLPFMNTVCPVDGFKDATFMDNMSPLVSSQWLDFHFPAVLVDCRGVVVLDRHPLLAVASHVLQLFCHDTPGSQWRQVVLLRRLEVDVRLHPECFQELHVHWSVRTALANHSMHSL